MHVPDGYIDPPVSLAAGAVAATAVALALRGARRELDAGAAPLAGLVAAFVFAVQMLNFPVAAGTSGHLLGGALAAILAGPWTGLLCITVVLLAQAFLFADGGLTALGVNITDMAVVTTAVGYAVFRGLLAVLPRRPRAVTFASFGAALVSVPAAACAFTLCYALGGTTDVPVGTVFAAMTGVHVLIGVGEAVITAMTVSAVLAVRPDLVHGARATTRAPDAAARPRRRFAAAVMAVTVVLAGFVSYYAATTPDGLEKVARDKGIDREARETAAEGSPLADYRVKDVSDARASGALAGVVGVGVTLAAGTGVLVVLRRRRARPAAPAADTEARRTEAV
ncbi:energy-coupling factor ABC transporter permease [Streptomyces mobaraensis NBRC 13819 = DSM 40847]|uniref:Cobalt ABC transporter permease component n=1 Tax=Streptomyces mobaraensis (strain ATCC 29032 / DSM 40847 / JCM 4168 / NBRC 13819 / NCIMB 11159 / IPCR 16-22) TaxID=1223523 RepID=M2ZUI9_STRM1|nr:energy-coupling factor ABC transporter permease [Streptomyces mobaraensis]EME96383.1 cobalt ABC transporter permease component [Streptomyces mobaraensis NBRC 13819 = DSM 40847]QTT74196.1 energy-coupling factor ABC transporter permease [Streptomyces mobaraensis NBRC 13819 = DSM 40847]